MKPLVGWKKSFESKLICSSSFGHRLRRFLMVQNYFAFATNSKSSFELSDASTVVKRRRFLQLGTTRQGLYDKDCKALNHDGIAKLTPKAQTKRQ